MEKEVLGLTQIQEALNEDYIFVKVDVDFVKLPFDLKKRFKGMTPTFFILTSAGEVLNIYPGAWVKNDFLEILKENL
jgi:thioredoxin-related protein